MSEVKAKMFELKDHPNFLIKEKPIEIELSGDEIIEFNRAKIRQKIKLFIDSKPEEIIDYLNFKEESNPDFLDDQLKFIRSMLKIKHLNNEECLNGLFEFLLASRNMIFESRDNQEKVKSYCKSICEQVDHRKFGTIPEVWY